MLPCVHGALSLSLSLSLLLLVWPVMPGIFKLTQFTCIGTT